MSRREKTRWTFRKWNYGSAGVRGSVPSSSKATTGKSPRKITRCCGSVRCHRTSKPSMRCCEVAHLAELGAKLELPDDLREELETDERLNR
jgi:hypothetical protein